VHKALITPELVRGLLREQFPQWAELPVTRVDLDGWDNTTFRLGDDMSVRLPSGDAYVAQVDKEQQWLPVLAPLLPLPIPQPLAKGVASATFPRPWSVYRWIPGKLATDVGVTDLERFAADVAAFLRALRRIDASDGPAAGAHSHGRGGPVARWDGQTRDAIAAVDDRIDAQAAIAAWDRALHAEFTGSPVWVHGDVVATNLLVCDRALSAVIDWGCSAVGDPACDVAIAWTLFHRASRRTFRDSLDVDDGTWERGRGWALWKTLLELHHGAAFDARTGIPGWRRQGWRAPAEVLIADLITDV
jgi:aminoglycoside phosphotransferase (APT) family kinase protein